MAQWFHRSAMKASGRPNFELGPVAQSISARMLCSQLREKRQTLMAIFTDFSASSEVVIDSTNQYVSLLLGFVNAPDSANFIEEESDSDSEEVGPDEADDATIKKKADERKAKKKEKEVRKKSSTGNAPSLRRLVQYTWTDSLDVKQKKPISMRDANFELIGILFNLALWLTKHAAKIASNNDIEMGQAVQVFTDLRNAAGIFNHIKTNLVGQVKGTLESGSDLDTNILEAYTLQSLAEAQEVTIARAMELKHDPSVIAALASQTATLYDKCKFGLQSAPESLTSKWRAYCIFKASCFRAYAHCFHSESELKADRCGVAIASAQEAMKYCTQAQNAAKAYRSGSGAEYVFIRRLQPYAQRTLTKAQFENSSIYHQKVPASMPQLDLRPTFGVATAEMPQGLTFELHESWKEAMPGFDLTKVADWISRKEYKHNKKESLKPVSIPEQPIYHGDKDPNNESGCVIA